MPGVPAVLYVNADFYTLDPRRPTVRALLVDGERIVAAGTVGELRALAPAGTSTVDLENRCAVPGFTDAHIHTASLARAMQEVDLRDTRSVEQALDRVQAAAGRYRDGEWIFGGWWDFNKWEVPVQPDRHGLDAVCPRNPVALTSADAHTLWVNSLALRELGIGPGTPDPAGGQIVRDADGVATGILREAAGNPVRALAASDTAGDLPAALGQAQHYLLSLGITSIHDIDAGALAGFTRLRSDGRLDLRVYKMLAAEELDGAIAAGIRTGHGDSWIRRGPVKIFADGAAGSHTCHMSEPFAGEPENRGIEVTPYPQLAALAVKAASAGIALAVHAIGDEANRRVLDAFAAVRDLTADHGLRHRIEHVQFLRRADVGRLAKLGVIASMQPQHCTSDLPLLGMISGRNLAAYAWRSVLDAGAVLAFGSDAPVEVPNPFHGLYAAITRMDELGEPAGGWEPSERITLPEAVHAYTAAAAFTSGEERLKGRLSPGMLADFAVLDTDIFRAGPEQIRATRVQLTVTGGQVRYRREP